MTRQRSNVEIWVKVLKGVKTPSNYTSAAFLNTLRTGDADLRFYITNVQDG